MPLKGIPTSITPELLYALARMGHGDLLVIADANFPSDSVASNTVIKTPIRIHGTTSEILHDILKLFPLDSYSPTPVCVMDRVQSDKDKNLVVPAYDMITNAAGLSAKDLTFVERFQFYEQAKSAFVVVQSDDTALYANVIVSKGVL